MGHAHLAALQGEGACQPAQGGGGEPLRRPGSDWGAWAGELMHAADQGFDDRKVFGQVLALGRSSWCGSTGTGAWGGGSLARWLSPGPSLWEEVELRLGQAQPGQRLHFWMEEVEVEGGGSPGGLPGASPGAAWGVVATSQLAGEGEGGGGAGGGGVPQAVVRWSGSSGF